MSIITKTSINLPIWHKGKVRDMYDLNDQLLMISTDRISAYDFVLPNGIPHKGTILTEISKFWFNRTKHIIDNHVISSDLTDYPETLQSYETQLAGRSLLVRKTKRIDIECVVRGYIAGSAWSEYRKDGTVCGMPLAKGLREADRLSEPIFTPATKAEDGEHDENISIAQMKNLVGNELSEKLIGKSLELFNFATAEAAKSGLILCDTKLEFGLIDGNLILIDEVFTPDSSRFWIAEQYQPGKSQHSLDKQYVRDYLTEIGWNKEPPVPELPDEVVRKTSERYLEVSRMLIATR